MTLIGTKDGKVSVKSAYNLLCQLKQDAKGQSTFSNRMIDFWKQIWRIKALNASRMFLWRGIHNSLPANHNLNRRKIINSPFCPIRKQYPETTIHTLWMCVYAQDVWGSILRKVPKMSVVSSISQGMVSHLSQALLEEEMVIFTTTVYLIWRRQKVCI